MASEEISDGIPPEHRDVYEAINNEVAWLHLVWLTYRQLFGRDEDTVKLLNSAVPGFARIVQDSLLDSVLLQLSRLTDRPTSGKSPDGRDRDNLTLDRLRPLAVNSGHQEIVSDFDDALRKVRQTCEALRAHRNKRIAHLDLHVALETEQLPPFSRQSIEEAMEALRYLLNSINHFYRHGPTVYEATSVSGDADSLLACLRNASRPRELRRVARSLDEAQLREALMSRSFSRASSEDQ